MPNRDIKESALTSATLAKLSHGAERFFWRLTLVADDFGRFEGEPDLLRVRCFPRLLAKASVSQVTQWIGELVRAGLVSLYRVDGKQYGFFLTWRKHQRQRAKHSKWPAPTDAGTCRQTLAYVPDKTDKTDKTDTTEDTETTEVPIMSSPRAEEPSPDEWSTAAWGTPEALAHLYNTQAPDNLAAVETLSDKRRAAAKRLLRQFPDRAWWESVFGEYKASRFLSGMTPPRQGHETFKADFDWLLQSGKKGVENAVRVHDGVYR